MNLYRRIFFLFIIEIFLIFTLSLGISAEPKTLYKAQNIAIARENIKHYKWARKIIENWKSSVALTMKKNRSFFEDMISELTPWPEYGQNCPVCVGKMSSMGECGIESGE